MIVDRFGRTHNYLRISLTDNCNFRCVYCMPDDGYDFTPSSQLMQPDEIVQLAKIFVARGVDKIRLTGGEPLVRKDAAVIIKSLAALPVALTLTTNGTRVHEFMDVFKEARIRSLNISLDTLQQEKFLLITRRDVFQQVFDNINLLLQNGFQVKINVVVMKDVNDSEIHDFLKWTRDSPVHIRFIEFMPFSGNRWTSNKVVTLREIIEIISTKFAMNRLNDEPNTTAKAWHVPGHAGTFSVISTMSDHFCGTCNRMRLTADGKMKNCLFSKTETDLLLALRSGENVASLIQQNIGQKAKALGGQMAGDFNQIQAEIIDNRSMITIGG